MKSITIFFLTLLAGVCYATEDEDDQSPKLTKPVEIVLVCPKGSKHEGDKLPEWVTTKDAEDFYCNESVNETEIAE